METDVNSLPQSRAHAKRSSAEVPEHGDQLPDWLARKLRLLTSARKMLADGCLAFDATAETIEGPPTGRYSGDLRALWGCKRVRTDCPGIETLVRHTNLQDQARSGFRLDAGQPLTASLEALRKDRLLHDAILSADVLTVLRPGALAFAEIFSPPDNRREVVLFLECSPVVFAAISASLFSELFAEFGTSCDIRSDGENVLQFRRSDRGSARVILHSKSLATEPFAAIKYAVFSKNALFQQLLLIAERLVVIRKRKQNPPWWHLPGLWPAEWVGDRCNFVLAVITDDGDRAEWVAAQRSTKARRP
ncbi:hypothetical protein [Aestuariivirga sp.]|uniref:hypothetical protein n=1 Tax=Aestuariivirga sp. TaxID=2650926 RepID=UPI0039E6EAD9